MGYARFKKAHGSSEKTLKPLVIDTASYVASVVDVCPSLSPLHSSARVTRSRRRHGLPPRQSQVGAQAPLGYFDPCGILTDSDEATFNTWRSAETKHGRIAMMAVLGAPAAFSVLLRLLLRVAVARCCCALLRLLYVASMGCCRGCCLLGPCCGRAASRRNHRTLLQAAAARGTLR